MILASVTAWDAVAAAFEVADDHLVAACIATFYVVLFWNEMQAERRGSVGPIAYVSPSLWFVLALVAWVLMRATGG